MGREFGRYPTQTPQSSATARREARRVATGGAIVTVLLGLGLTAITAVASLPLWVQILPFAMSLLVLGLPHGAVDHLVLPRASGEAVTVRSMLGVGLLYLIVGGSYAVVWVVTPVVAFAGFILLTAVHWGQGDVYTLRSLFAASHTEHQSVRVLTLVVRGAFPMLIPLVAFPEQYALVATSIVSLFDPGSAGALEPAFTTTGRLIVGASLGVLTALTLGLGFVRAGKSRDGWRIDAIETVGLAGYFALVPPILAIGLYFCFWHSLRHVLRTMLVDPNASQALADGSYRRAWGQFARDATPLTLGGLIVIGLVALAVPESPADVGDALGVYLVAIAVLTLPHVVVVALLDRIEGVWQ
ncbi:Brp/Blh family beta-carotene 15,15'-dioxygenase [Halobacteria archaeon AArc-dxtr1]|nr:Brp/Blh family beta-carotene 15,15'-dioxygenase [Halobacteria archaeon AArc-dxtr1]